MPANSICSGWQLRKWLSLSGLDNSMEAMPTDARFASIARRPVLSSATGSVAKYMVLFQYRQIDDLVHLLRYHFCDVRAAEMGVQRIVARLDDRQLHVHVAIVAAHIELHLRVLRGSGDPTDVGGQPFVDFCVLKFA